MHLDPMGFYFLEISSTIDILVTWISCIATSQFEIEKIISIAEILTHFKYVVFKQKIMTSAIFC